MKKYRKRLIKIKKRSQSVKKHKIGTRKEYSFIKQTFFMQIHDAKNVCPQSKVQIYAPILSNKLATLATDSFFLVLHCFKSQFWNVSCTLLISSFNRNGYLCV